MNIIGIELTNDGIGLIVMDNEDKKKSELHLLDETFQIREPIMVNPKQKIFSLNSLNKEIILKDVLSEEDYKKYQEGEITILNDSDMDPASLMTIAGNTFTFERAMTSEGLWDEKYGSVLSMSYEGEDLLAKYKGGKASDKVLNLIKAVQKIANENATQMESFQAMQLMNKCEVFIDLDNLKNFFNYPASKVKKVAKENKKGDKWEKDFLEVAEYTGTIMKTYLPKIGVEREEVVDWYVAHKFVNPKIRCEGPVKFSLIQSVIGVATLDLYGKYKQSQE